MSLAEKVVVITGGARGIGAALARRFGQDKPRGLVISDIDLPAAELVALQLRDAGVRALAVRTDVGVRYDAERLIATAQREFGEVDLLCSNAGIATGMGVHAPTSIWNRAWSVNVLAHVHLAHALLPSMSRRRKGHVVITASAAGLLGLPGDAPYAATKSAAVAVAEWLATTYGHLGIKVQALCPLGVRTDLLMPSVEAGHRAARAVTDLDVILEPEEVADAVAAGLDEDGFFIFPHREVGALHAAKALNTDAWIERQSQG
ncbi:SDR family oxidoreductase [Lentzea sp. JNUCC 0626]|uniref:SDR family oxidoreductase n=1 Tax=Lentzea sp. JNUCC 0626 TaxID=3367513 RepID=UPI003747C853